MQMADAGCRIEGCTVLVGHHRIGICRGDLAVEIQSSVVFKGTERVAAAARGTLDPLDVRAVPVATHEAKIALAVLVPRPVNAAAPHLVVIDRQGRDEESHMVFGDGEVMHAADIRHSHFGAPYLAAVAVDLKCRDDIAAEPARLITE